jgi:hypothetical protein
VVILSSVSPFDLPLSQGDARKETWLSRSPESIVPGPVTGLWENRRMGMPVRMRRVIRLYILILFISFK